jgi:outer membrane lipoprotein
MRKNVLCKLTVVLWMVWAIGCAGAISKQARSKVTYGGSFRALQQAPDKATGEIVMLGGKIIEVQSSGDHSELTMLQLPLDASRRPAHTDSSEGRFILRSKPFLDPAIYSVGTLMTVVGQVQGSEERLIGNLSYRYPVIIAEEIKIWPSRTDSGPGFHFGIGVGTSF